MNFLTRLLLVPLAGMFIWIARRAEDAYQRLPRAAEQAVASQPRQFGVPEATRQPSSPRPLCLALLWHGPSPRPSLYYSLLVLRSAN